MVIAQVSKTIHCTVKETAVGQQIKRRRGWGCTLLLCLPSAHLESSGQSVSLGVGIAQQLECRTHVWKVTGLNPCRSSRRIFCADSYFGICSTPMLPQQHVKDPGHSAKSAGGRLQLNMHTPYVCRFAWSDMVHRSMVDTELALRWQQFHMASFMPVL